MFSFDKKDFQRFAVSTIGAVTLSAASVFAAAAPVRAAVPAPLTVADWQGKVERQVDNRMHAAQIAMPADKAREAVVAVRFTADGDFAGAKLARSSGMATYDRHALYLARHIAYPALPAGLRGSEQTVEMRLAYGVSLDEYDAMKAARKARAPQLAKADGVDGFTVAAK